MNRSHRFRLPFTVAAAWIAAGSTLLPLSISVVVGAACVLVLPGLLTERALHARIAPYGAASAPARWLTLSVALIALSGLLVSVSGGSVHSLLLAVAATSLALSLVPARSRSDPSSDPEGLEVRSVADAPERPFGDSRAEWAAIAALCVLVVVAVVLAAAAPNVARDRMWYLAFLTRLSSGAPIDWSEPFLGTGNIAPRFAYNGWLLTLAAWSSLAGAMPSLVFERLAPTFLTVATASAAWHFGRRTVALTPGLAALATMATILATRFPFFSPDRYPFFARIAEDKSVALLIFAPVVLVAVAEAVDRRRRATTATWASLALTVVAVAFGHGLVMLLVAITVASLWLFGRNGAASARRVLAVLIVAALVAAVPGRTAMLARERIVDVEEPADAWSDDVTHPVVRAHLRLERTRDLPVGGPIVDPRLVADPLLLVGLSGVVVAWRRRREMGPALLVGSSLPFLVLAFVPFLAPVFGKIVLPWMAYRALWPIPFGSLLALAVGSIARRETGTWLRGGTALVLLATTLAALPWDRTSARPDVVSPLRDSDTREMLAHIAALPVQARIAAAPGFAELVPALSGRAVVALPDRATFVFAGSHEAAEGRLRASAAVVGLAPGSPRMRRAAALSTKATHFVLDDVRCGRAGRQVFRSGALRLCEVRAGGDDTAFSALVAAPASGAREHDLAWMPRAELGNQLTCKPAPERDGDVYGWRRDGRWTAKPVTIRCRARLDPPSTSDLSLVLAATLPRARETMMMRAVLRTTYGRKIVRHAAVPLSGEQRAVVDLPGSGVGRVSLRLTPAYLPYVNLRELFLREQRRIGE